MNYHICCCTDDNYAQPCAAMLCSLLENNKLVANKFIVHILISDLSTDNRNVLKSLLMRYDSKCEFHNVDSQKLIGVQFRKFRPLTEAAYYRILLSSVLSTSINKVLYLDCDLIVLGDITELFDIELENYPLAAVEEPVEISDAHRRQLSIPYGESYFNSGVLLINLNYWREHNCELSLLEFSKRPRNVYCHDQDALNYVFKGIWYKLPPKYNKSNIATLDNINFFNLIDLYEYSKHPVIIHYIDEPKPWQNIWLTRNKKLYYRYLQLSQYGTQANALHISMKKKMHLYKSILIYYLKSFLYILGLLHFSKKILISLMGRISNKT